MKYIFLLFFALFSIQSAAATFTPEEEEYIRKAVTFYRDFHAGNYRLVITSTSISNKMVIAKVAIICAGEIHSGTLQFPATYEKYLSYNNFLHIGAGNMLLASYSLRMFGRYYLTTALAADYSGKLFLSGGIGIGF